MFNINKWVCGLDFRRFPGPVFDPPQRVFRGAGLGGGGGGTVIYPNEFCFCLLTCNETWVNNLNGSIRKDTGHLSGFLSRAMVNSWNVKMRRGIEVNPLGFFSCNIIKCITSGLLSISKAMKALLLCLRHILYLNLAKNKWQARCGFTSL